MNSPRRADLALLRGTPGQFASRRTLADARPAGRTRPCTSPRSAAPPRRPGVARHVRLLFNLRCRWSAAISAAIIRKFDRAGPMSRPAMPLQVDGDDLVGASSAAVSARTSLPNLSRGAAGSAASALAMLRIQVEAVDFGYCPVARGQRPALVSVHGQMLRVSAAHGLMP